ncbi:MAG: ASCH domain-containing protein, partial [Lactobacillus johnsonii]|nr:ASCH domain-containing protein [Lactobacillus johnsonii]
MNKQLKQFWQDFCQKHNLECDTPVEAWAFGATAEDADELADLVNRRIKTATTSAYE